MEIGSGYIGESYVGASDSPPPQTASPSASVRSWGHLVPTAILAVVAFAAPSSRSWGSPTPTVTTAVTAEAQPSARSWGRIESSGGGALNEGGLNEGTLNGGGGGSVRIPFPTGTLGEPEAHAFPSPSVRSWGSPQPSVSASVTALPASSVRDWGSPEPSVTASVST